MIATTHIQADFGRFRLSIDRGAVIVVIMMTALFFAAAVAALRSHPLPIDATTAAIAGGL